MAYPTGSKIAELEARHADSLARVDATRRKCGELTGRLQSVEDRWSSATAETMTAEAFAVLSAERELLLRSLNRARQDLEAVQRGHAGVRQAYEQGSRSLLDAQDKLRHAEYRGDTRTMREMERAIASWLDTAEAGND